MTHFWMLAFRNLWARKTRTLVTASGIALGIAAMLAVSVMAASTAQSLKDFFAQSSGRANLAITEAGSSGEGLPARALLRVRAVDGVQDAVGSTLNRVSLLTKDKSVPIAISGIDPESDRRVRTYKLASGQFVETRTKAHNAILVGKFAADYDIALGDTITLRLTDGTDDEFKVIGLLTDEGAGRLENGSIAFTNLQVAQDVFGRGNRVDQIDVVATPDIAGSQERLNGLKDTLQQELGDKFTVSFPASTGESISQAVSGLNLGLSFFSMIALFVGMLLIYNTFQMTVAERTHEIGVLRSIGASKGQVLRLVLTEAVFLGVIGSAVGIGIGLFLSIPLVRVMSAMFGIPLETFIVPPEGLIQAGLVGLIATLIAALMPAWQASRISPTEALRARGGSREGFLMRHSWQLGLVLAALAVLDGLGIISLGQGPQFFVLTFLGAILLMPNIILLFERGGRGLVGLLYGPMGPIGSRNLARSKARSSLTVGVLMIGVVLTVAMGAMSISFKDAMRSWVDSAIGGDYFVSSSDPMRVDMARDILEVKGIQAVTPQIMAYQTVVGVTNAKGYTIRDDMVQLVGIDVPTFNLVNSLQFVGGEDEATAMAALNSGDAVFVSTTMRDKWGVKHGDSVRLRTSRGERDFQIVAMIASFWSGGQTMTLSRRDMYRYYGDDRVSMFLVKKKTDAAGADVLAGLKESVAKSKSIEIIAAEEMRSTVVGQMQQIMGLFDAMVWIAVIISALGVVNTMTMNVLERVREIGTLRSIGTTRRQLALMILSESGMMGLLGSIFGVAVAAPVSLVMVQGMKQGSGFQMSYVFPSAAFVTGVVIALVVSQLAALYPTWRAGRINIIEAIKEE